MSCQGDALLDTFTEYLHFNFVAFANLKAININAK